MSQYGARMKLSALDVDGRMTNLEFIAGNGGFAVNWGDCVEGIARC